MVEMPSSVFTSGRSYSSKRTPRLRSWSTAVLKSPTSHDASVCYASPAVGRS